MTVEISTKTKEIRFKSETNQVELYKPIDILVEVCHIIEDRITLLNNPPVNVWHKKGDYEVPEGKTVIFYDGTKYWMNFTAAFTHFLIPHL